MDTSWLARKYSILGQEASAQQTRAQTDARLGVAQGAYLGAQTNAYPGEAAARVAEAQARAEATRQQALLTGAQAGMVEPLARSSIALQGQQGVLESGQGGYYRTMSGASGPFIFGGVGMPPPPGTAAPTDPNAISTQFTGAGSKIMGFRAGTADIGQPAPKGGTQSRPAKPATSAKTSKQPLEARAGHNKVPGRGDGTVDTTHAMLAPGEAVLNKSAAEYLGRSTIDVLNHIGRIKMGLDTTSPAGDSSTHQQAVKPGQAQASQPGGDAGGEGMGYANGIPNVPAPGQMITSGTWTLPANDTQSGSGIRASLGMGTPRVVNQPTSLPAKPGGLRGLLGFVDGTDNVPPPPSGATMAVAPLRLAMGTSDVPDPHLLGPSQAGRSMTVSQPGSDVMDRWNTGLPMYAKGISKVPGKGSSSKGGAKPPGKGAGLTPGLMAAILGGGMGAPPGGAPGGLPGAPPPGLGPSMQMPAPAMGR